MQDLLMILREPEAQRVLTLAMLRESLGDLPPATLSRRVAKALDAKMLVQVRAGVYLNTFSLPPPKVAEATPYVRTGAVVSLQTVLGDASVLNNYTPDVTCVIPSNGVNTTSGEVDSPAARFRFYRLNADILNAGEIEDRLVADIGYLRATPEKALIDWMALAAEHRSNMTAVPAHDIDWQELDERRLLRIAKAAGMTSAALELKAAVEAARDDESYGMGV